MSDLAKKLGDNGIPLANLMPYLERCEENRPDFNYGLDEVNELLYSIRQLITDQNDVGGELSWRHHEGDLAFNLQDAKALLVEKAAKAKIYAQNKAAEAKIYAQNKAAEAKKYAQGAGKNVDDRLTHRKEDLAQADTREKLTAALFQPPPGWPWG